MSGAAELAEEVRRIQLDHYQDGDGGYAAVAAIRAFWRKLELESQQMLKEVLAEFVVGHEAALWSLSWEALVQEEAMDVAQVVFEALRSRQGNVEWADEIVLGLLRLRYREGAEYFRDYVGERLTAAGPLVLPLVAALARVSSEDSIELASEYIVKAKRQKLDKRVEKYAPSFVRHYLAVDDALLHRLITALKKRDAETARTFAAVLNTYLAKSWMLKELGEERSAHIRAGLSAAAELSN